MQTEVRQALQQAGYRLLGQLPVGVVLLDRRTRVLYANATARRCADDGLRLEQARLSHTSPRHARRLDQLVQETLRGEPTEAITLPGHRQTLLTILASSIARHDRDGEAGADPTDAAVMLFIDDRRGRASAPLGWTRAAYGLTPAEARVATIAFEGAGVTAIARRLEVSPNTVKTHLQRIFGKTQTSGQAELIRLLAPLALVAGREPIAVLR